MKMTLRNYRNPKGRLSKEEVYIGRKLKEKKKKQYSSMEVEAKSVLTKRKIFSEPNRGRNLEVKKIKMDLEETLMGSQKQKKMEGSRSGDQYGVVYRQGESMSFYFLRFADIFFSRGFHQFFFYLNIQNTNFLILKRKSIFF